MAFVLLTMTASAVAAKPPTTKIAPGVRAVDKAAAPAEDLERDRAVKDLLAGNFHWTSRRPLAAR